MTAWGGPAAASALGADLPDDEPAAPGVAVAVVSGGDVREVEGFGRLATDRDEPVGPGTMFHAASVSKLVCAVGVLRLVAEGRLDLDEDVDDRLRSWQLRDRGARSASVTLRALLSHHAGVIDPDGSFGPCAPGKVPPTLLEVLRGSTDLNQHPVAVTQQPGDGFSYSDAGYCVVEQVLTDTTATPYADLMGELVLEPLAMTRSRFGPPVDGSAADVAAGHDRHGRVVEGRQPVYPYPAAAGLWSTPADLAAVLEELHAALGGRGRLGLTRELAAELVRGQGPSPWAGLGAFVAGPANDVRLTSLGWGVGFQCALRAYPHRGDAVLVMTNCDPGRPQEEALTGRLVQAVEWRQGWRARED